MKSRQLKVALCAAMTLDGRLSSDKKQRLRLGSDKDIAFLRNLRNTYDASFMGGETFRTWPLPPLRTNPKPYHQFVLTLQGVEGTLNSKNFFFEKWNNNNLIIIYTNKKIYEKEHYMYIEQEFTSVLLENHTPLQVLHFIEKTYPCLKILIEGGGSFCHPFLQSNTIDDIYLTIVPKVLGGLQSKGLCVGEELSEMTHYRIENTEVIDNEIMVHYTKK